MTALAPPESLRAQRVMLVEDESDIRSIAKAALERFGGLTVQPCGSCEEALAHAEAFKPDVLLLDVMMPGVDGPETLARLRQIPSLARTPVVFLTAKVQPKEVERLLALGAIGVIAKPFEVVNLHKRLAELLAAAQPPAPVEQGVLDELEALRREYADALPERCAALEQAWQARAGNQDSLATLRFAAHGLTGSGATLGFPEVSEVAAKIEQLLEQPELLSGNGEGARAMAGLLARLREIGAQARGIASASG